jgi:hypothetical protein
MIVFMRRLASRFLPVLLALIPATALAEGGEAIPGAPVYATMPPITFTVIRGDGRIDGIVAIKLALELEKGKTAQALEPFNRQLLDAFLVALQEAYDTPPADGSPVQIDGIKAKLLEAAQKVTGEGIVKAVYVESIGERGRSR